MGKLLNALAGFLVIGILVFAVSRFLGGSGDSSAKGPAYAYLPSETFERAKRENKPMLLIFSASWCGPCQNMKKNVYPSALIQPYHDRLVWSYLDVDREAVRPLAQQFGVHGIPHYVVLAPDGKAVLGEDTGGIPALQFAEFLEKSLSKWKP